MSGDDLRPPAPPAPAAPSPRPQPASAPTARTAAAAPARAAATPAAGTAGAAGSERAAAAATPGPAAAAGAAAAAATGAGGTAAVPGTAAAPAARQGTAAGSGTADAPAVTGRREPAATAPAPAGPAGQPAVPGFGEILIRGLWKENPGLCQLLGLCPLLAVTNSAINAVGLGTATLAVMVCSSLMISMLRRIIFREVRIPLYIVLIATLVSLVSLLTEAYFPSLFESLGIYLALIVTNCIVMGRAEAFAGRHDALRSAWDALAQGLGFGLVLFTIGSLREIIGSGTWMTGATELFGPAAAMLELRITTSDFTFLTAILPPGGFFALALLVALKNHLDGRRRRRQADRYVIRSRTV